MLPHTSTYDISVLEFVARHRIATTHQVVYTFFIYAGLSARHGFDVVRSLVDRGYLDAYPLDPSAGRKSRKVVRVTRAGWAVLGVAKPARRLLNVHWLQHAFQLQLTEMLLVRDLEGWQLHQGKESWALIRDWMLQAYRGRMLNSEERAVRAAIERMRRPDRSIPVLYHPVQGALRIVIPVHPRQTVDRVLAAIPQLFVHTIDVELACGDLERGANAIATIQRWSKRRKAVVRIHQVLHFRQRPHPARVRGRLIDRYAAVGLLPPRDRWTTGPIYPPAPPPKAAHTDRGIREAVSDNFRAPDAR